MLLSVISASVPEHLLLTRKLSSLCALCFLSRVLKQLNLPKMLSCLFRNRVGLFFYFMGGRVGADKFAAVSAPDRFFLPLLHLQHLPTAGLEQAGAQCSHVEREREGNLVQNPPVYECV